MSKKPFDFLPFTSMKSKPFVVPVNISGIKNVVLDLETYEQVWGIKFKQYRQTFSAMQKSQRNRITSLYWTTRKKASYFEIVATKKKSVRMKQFSCLQVFFSWCSSKDIIQLFVTLFEIISCTFHNSDIHYGKIFISREIWTTKHTELPLNVAFSRTYLQKHMFRRLPVSYLSEVETCKDLRYVSRSCSKESLGQRCGNQQTQWTDCKRSLRKSLSCSQALKKVSLIFAKCVQVLWLSAKGRFVQPVFPQYRIFGPPFLYTVFCLVSISRYFFLSSLKTIPIHHHGPAVLRL